MLNIVELRKGLDSTYEQGRKLSPARYQEIRCQLILSNIDRSYKQLLFDRLMLVK